MISAVFRMTREARQTIYCHIYRNNDQDRDIHISSISVFAYSFYSQSVDIKKTIVMKFPDRVKKPRAVVRARRGLYGKTVSKLFDGENFVPIETYIYEEGIDGRIMQETLFPNGTVVLEPFFPKTEEFTNVKDIHTPDSTHIEGSDPGPVIMTSCTFIVVFSIMISAFFKIVDFICTYHEATGYQVGERNLVKKTKRQKGKSRLSILKRFNRESAHSRQSGNIEVDLKKMANGATPVAVLKEIPIVITPSTPVNHLERSQIEEDNEKVVFGINSETSSISSGGSKTVWLRNQKMHEMNDDEEASDDGGGAEKEQKCRLTVQKEQLLVNNIRTSTGFTSLHPKISSI